jgi:uncharacterized membrane protein
MMEVVSIFFLAALPLGELRVALPLALFVYDMGPLAAFTWTFLGNVFPVLLLFEILPTGLQIVRQRVKWIDRWLTDWFEKMKERNHESYSKWGAFFLFFFVIIPGIGTGAWGATLLAVLLGIEARLAIPAIIAGVFVSGLFLLGVLLGIFSGMQLL